MKNLFRVVPGAAVIVLGAFVLMGERAFPAWFDRHAVAISYTGLNSAVCFVMAGVALMTVGCQSVAARKWQAVLGGLILTIALAVLLQHAFHWYPARAEWPYLLNFRAGARSSGLWHGVMGPATAAAFLLYGAAIVVQASGSGPAAGVTSQFLTVGMIGIALVGMFSGVLDNILFYDDQGPGHTLINTPSAVGLAVLGAGLYLRFPDTVWYRSFYQGREDFNIFATGIALFSLIALLTGLTAVGIVGRYAMTNFQQAWRASFQSNVELFQFSLEAAVDRSIKLVALSGLEQLVQKGASTQALQREVDRILKVAGDANINALQVTGPRGDILAGMYVEIGAGDFRASIASPVPAALYWRNGWHLLVRIPLKNKEREVGTAIAVVSLRHFDRQFARMNQQGRSGEGQVCARDGTSISCFPSRFSDHVTHYPMQSMSQAAPVPAMVRALSGKEGVAGMRDYRGNNVIAAYGALSGMKLGLVQKIDTDEFYEPLRRQLWFALLGLIGLILGGGVALYWRTRPLVTGLIRTRARLDAILNNVPAGVMIVGHDGVMESANRTAEQMFGYEPGKLAGRHVGALLRSGEESLRLLNPGDQILEACRKDGSAFAVEVIVRESGLGRECRHIAIALDISEHKRMEQRLSQSEQLLRKVLEALPVGVWVMNAAGSIVMKNPAAERICHGIAPGGIDRFDGCKAWYADSGVPIPPGEWGVARALRDGVASLNDIIDIESADGARKTLSSSAVPLLDAQGAISGAVAVHNDITQERRAEQALRKSETSLANAQHIAQIGNWDYDFTSSELYCSGEVYRIFGFDPQLGRPTYRAFISMVHVDDQSRLMQAIDEAVKAATRLDIKCRLVFPDGPEKTVHAQADMVFDAAGRPVCMNGVVQDITEKTVAEDLLCKREEQFRALVENSPDMIGRFDLHSRCIYANPAMEKGIERSFVDLGGKMPEEMGLPASVASLWTASIKKVFLTRLADTFDFSIPTPTGDRHYQIRMVPEHGPDGRARKVLAVARDISVIKGGEAVLRESEQRLHGITSNIPGMVFQCLLRTHDDTPGFTYVSEGAVSLLDLTPGRVQADRHAIPDCIAERDRAAFHASLRKSATSMTVWNWEGRVTVADEERWINCRATPRRNGSGDIMWDGVMFNISGSKRNEEEIRQSRQLLRELSAHMESVREEERKRIAREVHDELGQSLTALRMDVSMLRLNFGGQSPHLLERIQTMREMVDRTIQLVRHITSTLRPAALDLGLTAAIEWLVEDFAQRTGIVCRLEAGGCEVVLDDSRATALFRIVQESLLNVTKHAQASRVDISIREEPDHVCVEVRDNGRGFATEAGQKPGSFGLVGMRERALMIGGTLKIHSEPGAGTGILICIPFEMQ